VVGRNLALWRVCVAAEPLGSEAYGQGEQRPSMMTSATDSDTRVTDSQSRADRLSARAMIFHLLVRLLKSVFRRRPPPGRSGFYCRRELLPY
jgi:hypothetical protein